MNRLKKNKRDGTAFRLANSIAMNSRVIYRF